MTGWRKLAPKEQSMHNIMATYYHGTSRSGAKDIMARGVDQSKSEKGYFGRGFYMAEDAALAASNYAGFQEDEGAVLEVEVADSASILDLSTPEHWDNYDKLRIHGQKIGSVLYMDDIDQHMVRLGVDGIKDNSFGGVVIYNTKVITNIKERTTS